MKRISVRTIRRAKYVSVLLLIMTAAAVILLYGNRGLVSGSVLRMETVGALRSACWFALWCEAFAGYVLHRMEQVSA